MDQWTMILQEVEDMWVEFAARRALSARELPTEEYVRERDEYKARRIRELYGEEYYLRFKGGCLYGTNKRMD